MKVPQTFECVKLDKKRGNIVLSRRAIMERIRDHDRDKIVSKMKEGDVVQGTVKNLTDWGAFIDLNGADALLHITDISWTKINNPSEILTLGEDVKVKVLKFDEELSRLSLGIKQLQENPWDVYETLFAMDTVHEGTVVKLKDKAGIVSMAYGVEAYCPAKHMKKEDGSDTSATPGVGHGEAN